MEQKKYANSQYVPTINENGEVCINGLKLNNVRCKSDLLRLLRIPSAEMKREVWESTDSPAAYKKALNKLIGDKLGMSPNTLFQWYKKLWYKQNVVPVTHHKKLFLGKKIDVMKLWLVQQHKDVLDQGLKDGQHNLLPLFMATGKNAQALHEVVGKGVWKKLCGNTFHRNMAITKYVSYYMRDWQLKEALDYCVDTPTTLLEHVAKFQSKEFLISSCKGKWKDYKEMRRMETLYLDTEDMSRRLNLPFNPRWSIRRMKEEHDRMAQLELAKKYSKDTFKSLESTPLPLIYKHEGLTAHLLQSPYEMQEEGSTQRHCVAGYSEAVAEGRYAVYSIRDTEGKRVSTAGYTILHGVVRLQQHYGFTNSTPTREACELVASLCHALCKMPLDKQHKQELELDNAI